MQVPLFANTASSDGDLLVYSMIGLGLMLLLWAVVTIANHLLQVQAEKVGVQPSEYNMSIFPSLGELIGKGKKPSFVAGESFTFINKGYDLKLSGETNSTDIKTVDVSRVSVSPYDYRGIAPIPKLTKPIGSEILAGEPLFFDKSNPDLKYVSPVSGEIVEIIRGPKRSIAEVVVLKDKETRYYDYSLPSISDTEALASFMAETGLWTCFTERPFDVVPALGTKARDIFISTFDTAPLAPNSEVVLGANSDAFAKGVEVLKQFSEGQVYLGLDGNSGKKSSFEVQMDGVVNHYFAGKHPAGNVGTHIHKLKPINAGDKVWTMSYQDVIRVGHVFLNGRYDGEKIYALTGYALDAPRYVKAPIGASLKELLAGQTIQDNARLISGDALTGTQKEIDQFVSGKDDQITVLAEGDHHEMFGWLLPLKPRPTVSKTFPNFLYPNMKFQADTNTHGEKRAFVVSGLYDKVLPMDIHLQALLKSIIVEDFEKMEGLGILELTEEDVALAEFVCVSKTPVQNILRQGLDLVRAQG